MQDIEDLFWNKKDEVKDEKLTLLILIKKKFLSYIIAARLPSFLISAVFFLLGGWFSIGSFPEISNFLILFFLFITQFINGLTNMAADEKLDIFSRKQTIWIFKYVSSKEMVVLSIILSIISLVILWEINLLVLLIGFSLIVVTFIYSFPPIRLKTIPPFDTLANGLIFGTLPFFLGWSITRNNINSISVIYAFILGLSASVYYLYFSMQDIKTDKDFNIKTSCTLLGYNGTAILSTCIWVIIIILSAIYFGLSSFVTISFFICFPVIILIIFLTLKINTEKLIVKSISFLLAISSSIWSIFILLILVLKSYSLITVSIFIISLVYYSSGILIYPKSIKKLYSYYRIEKNKN